VICDYGFFLISFEAGDTVMSDPRQRFHLKQRSIAMIGRVLVALLLTLTMAAPVFANPKSPGADRREHNQKQRIKQGVRSGQLTREEARGLAAEQKAIRAKEREMKSGGVVTPQERRELHQDLNESSQHIFQEKHDTETR